MEVEAGMNKNLSALCNCGTCAFFVAFPGIRRDNGGEYVKGQCRTRAPFVDLKNPDGPKTMWPLVRNTDFCGEHAQVEV